MYAKDIEEYIGFSKGYPFKNHIGCIICDSKNINYDLLRKLGDQFHLCLWGTTELVDIELLKENNFKNTFITTTDFVQVLNKYLFKIGFKSGTLDYKTKLDFVNFKALLPTQINNKKLENNYAADVEHIHHNQKDRIKEIISSLKVNQNLREKLNLKSEKIFLAVPYISPTQVRILKEYVKKNPDKLDKNFLNEFIKSKSLEQTVDYCFSILDPGVNPNVAAISSGIADTVKHLQILDNMLMLHSAGSLAPAIRLPLKGKSLNSHINSLSPKQACRIKDDSRLSDIIKKVGKAIYDSYPKEICDHLYDQERTSIAFTDLPIEWMYDGKYFLSQISNICRLPEHPSGSIMAQHVRWNFNKYRIGKDILDKTLVVLGAENDDYLKAQFNILKNQFKNSNIQFISPRNIDEFSSRI